MTVYTWQDVISGRIDTHNSDSALTIGAFDGPHRGHETLFDAVLACTGVSHGVVTFVHPPKLQISGDVSTIALRTTYFEKKRFDFVIVIDFSQNFGTMKGTLFFDFLRTACRLRFLMIGSDFRCGYHADTGLNEIRQYVQEKNISLVVLPPFFAEGDVERISSSRIRSAISKGDFDTARKLLGYDFLLEIKALYVSRSVISQVLPPVGTYVVCVCVEAKDTLGQKIIEESDGVVTVTEDALTVNTSVEHIYAVRFLSRL